MTKRVVILVAAQETATTRLCDWFRSTPDDRVEFKFVTRFNLQKIVDILNDLESIETDVALVLCMDWQPGNRGRPFDLHESEHVLTRTVLRPLQGRVRSVSLFAWHSESEGLHDLSRRLKTPDLWSVRGWRHRLMHRGHHAERPGGLRSGVDSHGLGVRSGRPPPGNSLLGPALRSPSDDPLGPTHPLDPARVAGRSWRAAALLLCG